MINYIYGYQKLWYLSKDTNLFVRMQSKVCELILTQFFSSEIYKKSILYCKLFYKYS